MVLARDFIMSLKVFANMMPLLPQVDIFEFISDFWSTRCSRVARLDSKKPRKHCLEVVNERNRCWNLNVHLLVRDEVRNKMFLQEYVEGNFLFVCM